MNTLALVLFAHVRWLCIMTPKEDGATFVSVDGTLSLGVLADALGVLEKADNDIQVLRAGDKLKVIIDTPDGEAERILTFDGTHLLFKGLIVNLGQFKEALKVIKKK